MYYQNTKVCTSFLFTAESVYANWCKRWEAVLESSHQILFPQNLLSYLLMSYFILCICISSPKIPHSPNIAPN